MLHTQAVTCAWQRHQHVAGGAPGRARVQAVLPDVRAQSVRQDGPHRRLQAVEQDAQRSRGGAVPLGASRAVCTAGAGCKAVAGCKAGAGCRAANRASCWALAAACRVLPLHCVG